MSESKLSAKNLAHNTVQRAIEQMDKFSYESDEKLQRWMHTIARNLIRNELTSSSTRIKLSEKNSGLMSLGGADRFIDPQNIDITQEEWRGALEALNKERREVLDLHLQGFSNVEIGKKLAFPANTVGTRLFRGAQDLVSYFEKKTGKEDWLLI
jgi:RNA polymerase sigma factor (sigma-70 family)